MATIEAERELELVCTGCRHGFTAHSHVEPGGACCAPIANSPVYRLPCPCPGFRWLPAAAGPVSYSGAPSPVYGGG